MEKELLRTSPSFVRVSEKRSEGLKTYPLLDLRSRFRAFGVVTAPPFVHRWILRGGSLAFSKIMKF